MDSAESVLHHQGLLRPDRGALHAREPALGRRLSLGDVVRGHDLLEPVINTELRGNLARGARRAPRDQEEAAVQPQSLEQFARAWQQLNRARFDQRAIGLLFGPGKFCEQGFVFDSIVAQGVAGTAAFAGLIAKAARKVGQPRSQGFKISAFVAGARIDQGAIEIEEEATALTEEFGKVGD